MARPTKKKRTALSEAVKRLRLALGDTQQLFAVRTGLSVVSVARYETNSEPSQHVLGQFARLAKNHRMGDLALVFEGQLDPKEIQGIDFSSAELILRSWVQQVSVVRNLSDLDRQRVMILASAVLSFASEWQLPDEKFARLERDLALEVAGVHEELSAVGAIWQTVDAVWGFALEGQEEEGRRHFSAINGAFGPKSYQLIVEAAEKAKAAGGASETPPSELITTLFKSAIRQWGGRAPSEEINE